MVEVSKGRSVKLTLAYDGTDYVGWQRQANGVSVQALLEDALARIEERRVTVTGAGRTDAGVHALGQVASVRLRCALDDRTLVRALNAMLPSDIRVLCAEHADLDFHARYGALSKTYRYRIVTGGVLSPFERRYAWYIPQALDCGPMRAASALLRGRHDFAVFQVSEPASSTTVRTIFRCEMKPLGNRLPGAGRRDDEWRLTDHFRDHGRWLPPSHGSNHRRHVGRGGERPERFSDRRAGHSVGDRSQVGPTAPAHGLFLVRVNY